MLKKKTSVGLNFGLHWDAKEGYNSMETSRQLFCWPHFLDLHDFAH